MFDFTKEVVINSEDKFEVVAAHDNIPAKFRVHGGGEYFGKYVVESTAYMTEAQPGNEFELKLKMSDLKAGVTEGDIQILVELGLDRGDARGDWGSAMYYFKKPLLVTVSHEANADAVVAAFNKVGAGYGMIKAKNDGGRVVIEGGDDKIKVRNVKVYNILKDDVKELEYDWKAGYTDNVVEFGTANYLLHNLRMPTYENYRFTSPAAVEMPIAGTNYTQYTFLYCVPRPGLGGLSVAGQTNHSTTTHVFFVASSVAEKFKTDLESIGVTVKPVSEHKAELDKYPWEKAEAADGENTTTDPEVEPEAPEENA